MTDLSTSFDPHTALSSKSVIDSARSSAGPGSGLLNPANSEEPVEDYTIKCICGYQDDDGNSVFCERCDTWQHTECYYGDEHGRVPTAAELADFEHFCTDCKPRQIDAKAAINRQKSRKEDLDPSDRKLKKATSKSHKKKIKATDSSGALTNGLSNNQQIDDRASRSPLGHLPSGRRSKTHHRSLNSMPNPLAAQIATSHTPHKRSASSINSPSKNSAKIANSSQTRETYTIDFLRLYDNDPGDRPLSANLFSDIKITSDLSLWSHDVEALKDATNGSSHPQVFHRIEYPLHTLPNPELRKGHAQNDNVIIQGRHPSWTYLTMDVFTPKSSIVGELKGEIGHMKDYIMNPDNRWEYLRHPAPFVFFHPKLPIYIDTRIEGTTCRYLRRSCDPNLIMTTILENDSEYHFCFTAKQDIDAGTELTIGWVLDENMRKIFNPNHNGIKQEIGGEYERYIADWANNVLPEFGGCACQPESECAFARYGSKTRFSPRERNGPAKHRALRQGSHGPESRNGSENGDRRSTSRSKSVSRDLTPTGIGIGDSILSPGLEISDRDKRKIAALEKGFEKLENDKHQPAPKKKKRSNGGSNVNSLSIGPSASVQQQNVGRMPSQTSMPRQLSETSISISQPNTPSFPVRLQQSEVSAPRRKSGSPITKPFATFTQQPDVSKNDSPCDANETAIASRLLRRYYVSAAVQTDPEMDEDAWHKPPLKPIAAKKPYMSLSKRLLLRSQHHRTRLEERQRSIDSTRVIEGGKLPSAPCLHSPTRNVNYLDSKMLEVVPSKPGDFVPQIANSEKQEPQEGLAHINQSVTLTEVRVRPSSPTSMSPSVRSLAEQPPHVLDLSSANHEVLALPSKLVSLADPPVTVLLKEKPPLLTLPSPHNKVSSSYSPPNSSTASNMVQPGPVKKKVSLSDYMKRKGSHTTSEKQATGSPEIHHPAIRVPFAGPNGDGEVSVPETGAIVETPKTEGPDPSAAHDEHDL